MTLLGSILYCIPFLHLAVLSQQLRSLPDISTPSFPLHPDLISPIFQLLTFSRLYILPRDIIKINKLIFVQTEVQVLSRRVHFCQPRILALNCTAKLQISYLCITSLLHCFRRPSLITTINPRVRCPHSSPKKKIA